MIRKVITGLDRRVDGASFAKRVLDKVFPDHWSFMLGEIALYAFIVLVGTGIFLTFFFDPSQADTVYAGSYAPMQGVEVSQAYRSALEISFDVRAGLVMRQTHHWAALVFVAAILVHLGRVFFTGAFRRPRDINWIVGATLLLLAVFNGFTGYSLPDDVLSGTGLRVAYSIALSIPLAGTWLAFLVFGGEYPTEGIIPRLYSIHIMIIPITIGLLLSIHLALVWHQKHTQFAEEGRTEANVVGSRLWPTYAVKSVGLLFMVAAVLVALGGLVQLNPIWLYGPYDPAVVSSPAQPDWYLGWTEGALRLFPPWEMTFGNFEIPNPFFPGVLLPGVTFMILYAWPFLESWLTADHEMHNLLERPRDRPLRTALGTTTIAFYAVLFVGGSNDLIAKWLRLDVKDVTTTLRYLLVAVPIIAGVFTFLLMRALARSGAARLTELPAREILSSWRRNAG